MRRRQLEFLRLYHRFTAEGYSGRVGVEYEWCLMRFFAVLLVCVFSQSSIVAAQEVPSSPKVKISQFSGKPVPRFESLRYPAVHGRVGPSLDHPIAWKYERKGLPVLILKESQDWRYIRDPDGDEVWVHARMLTQTRTVLVRGETELKRKASAEARGVAVLQNGVVGELLACSGAWCQISAERFKGYVSRQSVWGSYAEESGL